HDVGTLVRRGTRHSLRRGRLKGAGPAQAPALGIAASRMDGSSAGNARRSARSMRHAGLPATERPGEAPSGLIPLLTMLRTQRTP
ncbi:MAG TPA: hypothetical protein PLC93_12105, partial [Rhodocyclaceae bacterium]|nr:hypothetical protein [Rhodocyclaceae bacterium]